LVGWSLTSLQHTYRDEYRDEKVTDSAKTEPYAVYCVR